MLTTPGAVVAKLTQATAGEMLCFVHKVKKFSRHLKIALFSSILVSGFTMLQLLVINPDMVAQMVKSTQEAYQGMMDSNTATAMEKMMNMIPAFTFVFTLLYCYLWGWMLSTAFARRLFPVNAFGERTPDDQNTDNDQ